MGEESAPMWEVLVPAAVAVITAALGWLVGRYRERTNRREEYTLERVEEILRAIVWNAETAHLDPEDPERIEALRGTKEALALIPIYGSERVRAIRRDQPEEVFELVEALQTQARQLLVGRRSAVPRTVHDHRGGR